MKTTNTITAAVLGLTLAFSAGTSGQAADNEPPEITLDGGQLYDNCVMDGGTFKDGKKSYSCSHGGKTTTCEKNAEDKDIACETSENSTLRHRFVKTKALTNTVFMLKR